MIQIIEAGTPKKPSFSQRLSAGVGRGLETVQQYSQQAARLKGAEKYGIDPEALRGLSPENQESLLADALRRNVDLKRAAATSNINLQKPTQYEQNQRDPEQRPRGRGEEFLEESNKQQRVELPEFEGMGKRGKRIDKGPGEPSQNMLPQQATTGKKVSVLDPQGVLAEAKRLQQEYNDANIPIDATGAWQIAQQQNESNKAHNAGVEAEQETSRIAQRDYGASGEAALKKVLPNATDEMNAIFQRKATEAASKYNNESDIKREIAQEAVKFKNTISNAENNIKPRRLFEGMKQDLLGTSRSAEKARDDIRISLKPLLDEGLYDTSRNILSKLGYHPEERESIISDLGEGSKRAITEFPKMERSVKHGSFVAPTEQADLSPVQNSILENSMRNAFKNEPSVNLLLLRKAYEEKGVDWRSFKDKLNDLINNDEIKLSPDQFTQMNAHLNTPPLNNLGKLLFGLKQIGR